MSLAIDRAALDNLSATMAQSDRGQSLIGSFGLFWKVEETEWIRGDGRKGKHRLLGRVGSKSSSLRVADFCPQSGIYVLYGNYGLYYVAMAQHRARRLPRRLSDKRNNA